MAARIQGEVPVPLIDSVSAGAFHALQLAQAGMPASAAAAGDGPQWQGLSVELAEALAGH